MPSNHYSGSDISRPEMGTMGIMNRARGMQIIENGFYVRMMFLLLGLLLSIVNLPTASGQNDPPPPPNNSQQSSSTPPPAPAALDLPPPLGGGGSIPPTTVMPPPTLSPPPVVGPSPTVSAPPPAVGSQPAPGPSQPAPGPSPVSDPPPPPPPTPIEKTGGDTWNESEKAGVAIASIAALLQVAVVAFLLIKRHQMLTTVEYDDIEDLEYDTPPDSNFRDIEST